MLQGNQNSPGLDSEADEVNRDPTQTQKMQPLSHQSGQIPPLRLPRESRAAGAMGSHTNY